MNGIDLVVHGKPWKYAHGSVGAARRAAEAGRSKIVQGRCTMRGRTVGRATSVSGVYVIYMYCTYMGESLPEVLHGLAKPGGGRREVSYWPLIDALDYEMH